MLCDHMLHYTRGKPLLNKLICTASQLYVGIEAGCQEPYYLGS